MVTLYWIFTRFENLSVRYIWHRIDAIAIFINQQQFYTISRRNSWDCNI